jgi:hypothetical protein
VFEPFVELIPAAFHWVELGEFRWEVPNIQILSAHARDRTVPDSFGLALTTHELPEIRLTQTTIPTSAWQLFSTLAD